MGEVKKLKCLLLMDTYLITVYSMNT